MTIRTTTITFEVRSSGLFIRLPIFGEAFIDFTGQGFTCWDRPVVR